MQKYKVHVQMTMDMLVEANSPEEATQKFYDNIVIDEMDSTVDVFNVTKQE